MEIPKIGSKWKHKSGKIYEVVTVSNLKATKSDYPITVVYKDDNEDIWSRTLEKWQEMEKIDEDN